jgi:hypothetical protein
MQNLNLIYCLCFSAYKDIRITLDAKDVDDIVYYIRTKLL